MKRSTKDIFYVSPNDFTLALTGIKTASTRLGSRRVMWPVGHKLQLVDNVNGKTTNIEITYHADMKLDDVTSTQAYNVGGYDIESHHEDFTSIYEDTNEETVVSLVGFRILGGAER